MGLNRRPPGRKNRGSGKTKGLLIFFFFFAGDGKSGLLLLSRFDMTALFLSLPHDKMQGKPTRIVRVVGCRWWPTSTKIEGEYLLQRDFLTAADVRGLKLLHVFKQIMTIIFSSFIIRTEIHRSSYICSRLRSYLPPQPGPFLTLHLIPTELSETRSGTDLEKL